MDYIQEADKLLQEDLDKYKVRAIAFLKKDINRHTEAIEKAKKEIEKIIELKAVPVEHNNY